MVGSKYLAHKLALLVLAITCLALFLWSGLALKSGQVRSYLNSSSSSNESLTSLTDPGDHCSAKKVKLLCWIMSVDSPNGHKKSQAGLETWARRCDKAIIVRNGTKFGEQDGVLTLPMEVESRAHLWHKVIEAFKHLHKNYLHEFDWFMKADDDTYVLVDHLRDFLLDRSSNERIYFGYKFKPFVKQGYMSGGSGYVLSREALRLLVEKSFEGEKTGCDLGEFENEDIRMGQCLEAVGVEAGDTRDSKGKPTFLALSPMYLINEHKRNDNSWYSKYAFYGKPQIGKDCCSDRPISFHYIEPKMMYLIDWLLYDVKRPDTTKLCPAKPK